MLNYTAHAIEELKVQAGIIKQKMPLSGDAIYRFIDDIRASPKFILPDYGSLIYNLYEMPEGIEMTRLPFSKIVLEVPYPSQNLKIDNIRECTKRLILAEEGVCNFGLAGVTESGPFTPTSGNEKPNCIKITVVAWYAEAKAWYPIMASGLVQIGTKSQKAAETTPEDDPYWENRKQTVIIPFMSEPFLEEVVDFFIRDKGLREYRLSVSNDIGIEISIVAEMLAVLNCRNVGTEIIAPSEKQNKARRRSGKEPFHEYHVLNVGGSNLYGRGSSSSWQIGDEYKVRQHLRRGHIRRLSDDHTVWVNQTVVAAGSIKGNVKKSYKIKS